MSESVDSVGELLPEDDRDFLKEKGYQYELIREGGNLLLIVKDFKFPAPYTPEISDLMIMIPSGYPNGQLDMFWTNPDIKLVNGQWPQACTHHEDHGNRNWQRWSRHNTAPWRIGVDCLRTFIGSIRTELNKGI